MGKRTKQHKRSSGASGRRAAPRRAALAGSDPERDLQERVKELQCLYGLDRVIQEADGRVEKLLQGAADLLPPSWQYPEVTCARILYGNCEHVTPGWCPAEDRQVAEIRAHGQPVGQVEVVYVQERPPADEGPFLAEERALIDAVADRIGETLEHIEAERERLRSEHDLRERVKELRCLYGIARLIERGSSGRQRSAGLSSHDIGRLMRGAVELLPDSWQYPHIACARILYEGESYTSTGFREARYRQTAPLVVEGEAVGQVEVYYLRKMPTCDEGPFLKEERALIDAVAERLSRTAEWFRAEQQLRRAHEELQVERKALQESNAALRAVLGRIEDEKSSIRQAIAANVEKILLPILHALEAELAPDRAGYVRLLRHHLEQIASPFVDRLSRRVLALTPAEVRVCSMVKMGLSTKEIARLRRVAPATVSRQRESIRKKLGLTGRDVNLATFLQTVATGLPQHGALAQVASVPRSASPPM